MLRSGRILYSKFGPRMSKGQDEFSTSRCDIFAYTRREVMSSAAVTHRKSTIPCYTQDQQWILRRKNYRQSNKEDSSKDGSSHSSQHPLKFGLLMSVLGSYVFMTKWKEPQVYAAKPFVGSGLPEDSPEGDVKRNGYDKKLILSVQEMAQDIAAIKKELASINSSPRDRYNFFSDAVDKVFPSVVSIAVQNYRWNDWGLHQAEGGMGSTGSGFVVSVDGIILTNAHVVSGKSSSIQVTLNDGRVLPAVVEDIDYAKDLAVIKINCTGLTPIRFGISSAARAGEFVAALGSPLSLKNSVTVGVVSSKSRQARTLGIDTNEINYIQTDAAITYGNSGGPLINLNAEVVGVNSMKLASGISFAIPIDDAKLFLDESLARRQYGKAVPLRPYMGLTVLTLNSQLRDELKQRTGLSCSDYGVLVWQVVVGSPAYRAGIQPGDVVTEVNGNAIKTATELYDSAKLSTTLHMRVQRGGKLYVCAVSPEYISNSD